MAETHVSAADLDSIVIVGSGVFGLSTALALKSRQKYKNKCILILDKSPFPAQDASSIDSSRVVRPDYADKAYAQLMQKARPFWREQEEYVEAGLVMVCEEGTEGEVYVEKSAENVKELGDEITGLDGEEEIRAALGTGGMSGKKGYFNPRSGFVNAEKAMVKLRARCEAAGVKFVQEKVLSVVVEESKEGKSKAVGVFTELLRTISADLIILAAGAWTPSIIDLPSQIIATGQVLGYLELTMAEQAMYENMPVLLNLSSGTYIIPPRNRILKVARHSGGYVNTAGTLFGKASVPVTSLTHPGMVLPAEAEAALMKAITDAIPDLAGRQFVKTRMCWYTDTRDGEFLVTFHPNISNLFLATGGSGHAFKFLPVLGDEVVDIIEGYGTFREKWGWKEGTAEWAGDGSRGEKKGGEGELSSVIKLEEM